jgi:serine protease Do
VKKKMAGDMQSPQFPQDELFRRFFGEDAPQHPRVMPTSGSGFLIDPEGHILTNNHVVSNAEDITVTLNDKRTFKAKVVGTDKETDVAIIKIIGRDLPYVPMGDSDKMRVGDWVIAIGNPMGELRGTVTAGIISAQGRTNLNIFGGTPAYQDFIQTDASINFGNSGGPLCNMRGEAIGINTAINPSGQGIGFAIPINLAKHVAEELIASGKVTRAWMGVTLADLTPELADGFGLKGQQGVIIQSVLQGQPADKAGIKRNDVVVECNGQPVTDTQKFRLEIADMPVGSRVHLVVLREGKRVPATIMLGERTDTALAQAQRPPQGEFVGAVPGGLQVRDLTPDEKSGAAATSGVMVTEVKDGSSADDAGLQPGDIVEEVSGKPVSSAADFAKLLREVKATRKHAVLLVADSNGNARYVALSLE